MKKENENNFHWSYKDENLLHELKTKKGNLIAFIQPHMSSKEYFDGYDVKLSRYKPNGFSKTVWYEELEAAKKGAEDYGMKNRHNIDRTAEITSLKERQRQETPVKQRDYGRER